MPHYAFRPGRFRAGRAHQCHVGNRGRPRRSDRTDSGIITEGKWHNRRVADPAFFIDQIRPLAGFSGMSALSFVIGDPVATDFFRDVAHEFEARDQGVDVGLGNDEILVVAGLYIGILSPIEQAPLLLRISRENRYQLQRVRLAAIHQNFQRMIFIAVKDIYQRNGTQVIFRSLM